jgi:hypothetical protein
MAAKITSKSGEVLEMLSDFNASPELSHFARSCEPVSAPILLLDISNSYIRYDLYIAKIHPNE